MPLNVTRWHVHVRRQGSTFLESCNQGSCPFVKIKVKDFQGPSEGYIIIRRTKLTQTGAFISISRQSGPLKSS